jgi:hypothetical protein
MGNQQSRSYSLHARPRIRFNDYMVLGPIDLANLNDGLRYSLDPVFSLKIYKYTERWGTKLNDNINSISIPSGMAGTAYSN